MKVIGAGFGRTGTTSLKLALEQLGLGPVLHGELFNDRTFRLQAPWYHKVHDRKVPWSALLDGYASAIDWPVCHYWKQLAQEYPDAKFVLTHRPSREWMASFKATIMPNIETHFHSPQLNQGWAAMIIGCFTFNMDFSDENLLTAYAKHVANVKGWFQAEGRDRLLVFNVQEGWAPLCRFLEVQIPDAPFPSTNDAEEFSSKTVRIDTSFLEPLPAHLGQHPVDEVVL